MTVSTTDEAREKICARCKGCPIESDACKDRIRENQCRAARKGLLPTELWGLRYEHLQNRQYVDEDRIAIGETEKIRQRHCAGLPSVVSPAMQQYMQYSRKYETPVRPIRGQVKPVSPQQEVKNLFVVTAVAIILHPGNQQLIQRAIDFFTKFIK